MNHHTDGDFSAPDGTRLWFERDVPDGARADVVLVHGYGDHVGRYRALRDALLAERLAVHGYDVRGHGRSAGTRGGVGRFQDYLDELSAFVARVRADAAGRPLFVFAHSHGGLITLAWLLSGANGVADVRGLVLSAPYLALAFVPPAWKTAPAKLLSRIAPGTQIPTGIVSADLSRDEAWQRTTDADPLYGRTATPRWFTEHRRAQAEVLASGARLTLPVLMLLAGDDRVASSPVAKRFFETLGSSDKRLREWPGMRHELFAELGKEEVHADVSSWISAHL